MWLVAITDTDTHSVRLLHRHKMESRPNISDRHAPYSDVITSVDHREFTVVSDGDKQSECISRISAIHYIHTFMSTGLLAFILKVCVF